MKRAGFPDRYKILCMMEEIKAEFGRPYARGQRCINRDDPKEIYTVELSGQKTTYIRSGITGTSAKTADLTWVPTIAEIRKHFRLEGAGFETQYKNFINYPEDYGYSRGDLNRYPSEEERWLLYAMWTQRSKLVGAKWVVIEKQ